MSDIALRVENLSKMYRIGVEERRPQGLWQAARSLAASPFAYLQRMMRPPTEAETLWALKDVSFEVKRGEVVGIIGRNGAGKSTLLKILSRITEPTSGRATINGRVGSLLEVGTGFHPELTGRENIYLNGAILGMRRHEIDRRYDEIVDFAGIERFLDTPVKRYSSGMYVRLAFAVAAHLEPEILLVDEVLAVGDAEFQKKCLGKMGDVAQQGRTVLFVSHNMSAVKTLCSSAIVIKEGSTSQKQAVESAITEYTATRSPVSHAFPIQRDDILIWNFAITQDGRALDEYQGDRPVEITIVYELLRDITLLRLGLFLTAPMGDLILRSLLGDWEPEYETQAQGKYEIHCQLPPRFLVAGIYSLELHCSRHGVKDYGVGDLTRRQIIITPPSDFNVAHMGEKTQGLVLIDLNWSFHKIQQVGQT